ncbi:MAG: hypothetical protein E7679_01360 [Ruminococcaceae bacterium]|nr:hypothetical protein [Oscillospiraceae bacterium]
MIRFIYGASGYGKTHTVINMLKEDAARGIHSFLIVPEQQAVSSEREMLCALPTSAQLNLEILNFSRLYNRVCREYGGLQYDYITKPAKHLLMWQNLRELSPMLEHYSELSANDPSLTDVMLSAVGEFKANMISPLSLERAAEKIESDKTFSAKLRDISLIYSAYNAAVSERFSDSADDISKLCDILKKQDFFRGCNVYIDSFTSFTSAEHAVIDRIFEGAANTTVCIPLPSPGYEAIDTASISLSERKLIKNAEKRGGATPIILTENHRAGSAALAHLSSNIWNLKNTEGTSLNTPDDGSVILEVCDDAYAEAEAAARHTLELMRRGVRCRDIVVIMRDAEAYRGIIEPAFAKNGIPFFFSEKSDLCSKSAVKFILSALKIKSRGWQSADVISHVKTALYPIPETDTDMFESYVKTWNIKGKRFLEEYWTMNPDGYAGDISERGKRILNAANALRAELQQRLIPLFARLEAAEYVPEMCRAVYDYLVDCNIEEALNKISQNCAEEGNVKEAEEYAALYRVILDALALIARTLPEVSMSTDEFAKALKLVFDMTEIGTIPTSVDEVVIGSASMIRANNPRCVLALGLCEGEFPKNISDTGILNSPERTLLKGLGIELSGDADTKSSDELMFVSKTFALPSEKLILLTPRTEVGGRSKLPSLPFERAKKLLPNVKEHRFIASDMRYIVGSAEGSADYIFSTPDTDTLRRSLSEREELSYVKELSRPDISISECKISPEKLKDVFPRKMRLSQSKLERYVRCGFCYYCSDILKLRNEEKAAFRSLEVGNFIHFILENLIRAVVDANGVLPDLTDEKLSDLAEDTVKRYIEYVCPEYERNAGRFIHLYRRLKNLSLLLAKNIIEEFSRSEFRPEFFELPIKDNPHAVPPLEFILKDGSSVSISGVVDRVDLLRKDGKIYVRVVDYKTGTKNFSIDDLELGLNTQMLIYLFSLCSANARRVLRADAETEVVGTGVVYLSSNIPTVELEDYTDPDEVLSKARGAFDRSGLLLDDEDILLSMNCDLSPDFLAGVKKDKKGMLSGKSLTSSERFAEIQAQIEEIIISIAQKMKDGAADASPLIHHNSSPCDYCQMKPICRRTEK